MEVIVLSETKQEFGGVVYYLCGNYFQRKGVRLHREVWKYHNGDIPKGYDIHHKDGNRSNNQIENLELKGKFEHHSDHMHTPDRMEYAKGHIEDIRQLAAEWHGSEEGRKWHGEHAKQTWEHRGIFIYTCEECGNEFETRHMYGENQRKFCSGRCRANNRRHSGVDDVERICVVCGKRFMANKYQKGLVCSTECKMRKRWNK